MIGCNDGDGSGSSVSDPLPISLSISFLISLIREDTENRASISLSFTGSGIRDPGNRAPVAPVTAGGLPIPPLPDSG